jgi:hypothetical protein
LGFGSARLRSYDVEAIAASQVVQADQVNSLVAEPREWIVLVAIQSLFGATLRTYPIAAVRLASTAGQC